MASRLTGRSAKEETNHANSLSMLCQRRRFPSLRITYL
jgi:hypothetical protein